MLHLDEDRSSLSPSATRTSPTCRTFTRRLPFEYPESLTVKDEVPRISAKSASRSRGGRTFWIVAAPECWKPAYDCLNVRFKDGGLHQIFLEFLKDRGLIQTHSLNLRRDGRAEDVRRFVAITLTKAGQQMVSELGGLPEGQRTYSGLVKPREAEHDTRIFCCLPKGIREHSRPWRRERVRAPRL